MIIAGAGLAGLIAAHAWPGAEVLEVAPAPRAVHKALLRFRTDAVARLTGIEFRRVSVRKGLWSCGNFREPNIQLANQYSIKVLGRLIGDRSIWSLEPVDRFIAPENLYEQMIESVGQRICWGCPAEFSRKDRKHPVVSTAPLPATLDASCGMPQDLEFNRAAISVTRYRVPRADLFQTIYFPDPDTPLYRASMTGSLLILEAAESAEPIDMYMVEQAFGFDLLLAEPLGQTEQRYGKIVPIAEDMRKHLLFELTHCYNIFSLGRFATWRNILLDDVVNDIDMIKRLMRSSKYDMKRTLA